MFHKIGIFPEKEEKRIVTLKNNSGKPFDSNMLMAKVKRSLVICSNKMPTDKMLIIKEIAKQNGITFQIHKVNVD